jgi:hypothetical protein
MPYVKQDAYLVIQHHYFNTLLSPGLRAPVAGIYKCTACGYEIAASTDTNLPKPHDDPRHDSNDWNCSGEIKWLPVAFAIQKVQKKPQ